MVLLAQFTVRASAKCANPDCHTQNNNHSAVCLCNSTTRSFSPLIFSSLAFQMPAPSVFFWMSHNKLCVRQTSRRLNGLICICFCILPQISCSMNLGLACVCRPVCWPLGSVLDSRHCVFALTLLTLLMQVVVEANSWWYALIFYMCSISLLPPPTPPLCVCVCVCVFLGFFSPVFTVVASGDWQALIDESPLLM